MTVEQLIQRLQALVEADPAVAGLDVWTAGEGADYLAEGTVSVEPALGRRRLPGVLIG